MEALARGGLRSVALDATVLRCGCSPEQRQARDWHGHSGQACPRARVEDLGRVAYWNRNPLRRAAWVLSQWMRGRRAGAVRMGG